jgi:hypothetical protein
VILGDTTPSWKTPQRAVSAKSFKVSASSSTMWGESPSTCPKSYCA